MGPDIYLQWFQKPFQKDSQKLTGIHRILIFVKHDFVVYGPATIDSKLSDKIYIFNQDQITEASIGKTEEYKVWLTRDLNKS